MSSKVYHIICKIVIGLSFVIIIVNSDYPKLPGKRKGGHQYYPLDSGFYQDLNEIRCVDYKGHVSGKSRWPYSCLLPASHLATGRLLDGTSSLPEREIAPPWLNLRLFKQGQKFAKDNSGHLLLSHIYGLFITNLFLDSKEVLLFTEDFDTPEKAARRYTLIANGIFNWYSNAQPATDFPSFDEVAIGIRNVRRAHRNVTVAAEKRLHRQKQTLINPVRFKSRSANRDLWKAFKRDIACSPIPYENRKFPVEYDLTEDERKPINQFIQAIAQFGFVGIPILFPERVGLTNATDQELLAFNHLWAVIGYCVGIRDEFNISLQPDLETAKMYFRDIFETFIQPAFFQVDFLAKIVIDPMLEGMQALEATMTPGVIATRILRDILKVPVPNSLERLNSLEKLSMAVTDVVVSNNLNTNRLLVSLAGENVLGTSSNIQNSASTNSSSTS